MLKELWSINLIDAYFFFLTAFQGGGRVGNAVIKDTSKFYRSKVIHMCIILTVCRSNWSTCISLCLALCLAYNICASCASLRGTFFRLSVTNVRIYFFLDDVIVLGHNECIHILKNVVSEIYIHELGSVPIFSMIRPFWIFHCFKTIGYCFALTSVGFIVCDVKERYIHDLHIEFSLSTNF